MEKSIRGFYYDLSISPYRLGIGDKIYVFSSLYRMQVFQNEVERITERLQKTIDRVGFNTVVELNQATYNKAYDKAQPTVKLILDGDHNGTENKMD